MDTLKVVLDKAIKDRGVSQREAARQIGVSPMTIARALEGMSVDVDTLIAICKWLGVTPSSVLDAEVGGQDGLAATMAAVLEANPELAAVFGEAIQRVESGKLDAAILEDVLHYAAFRLGTSGR